jgi:hypothetical protein
VILHRIGIGTTADRRRPCDGRIDCIAAIDAKGQQCLAFGARIADWALRELAIML